jgi:predicted nucleotidyltransferase
MLAKGIKLVVLFGSRVKGYARRDSDADVAVLADHPLSISERGNIASALAPELKLSEDNVDVVDLWDAPPLLGHEVGETGKLLHGNEVDFLRFRVLAWKRYQDTAKFRRAREAMLARTLHGK